jgi:hypothetical protein
MSKSDTRENRVTTDGFARGRPAGRLSFSLRHNVALATLSSGIGAAVTATVRGAGGTGVASAFVGVESLRPPAPARLDATFFESDLALAWTRRSRRGWHWVDESDAPLVEANEKYDLEIAGRNGSIQRTLDRPVARVPASELARIGPGGATVHVRQIGDWAMSRPTQMQVTLPKEKP